MGLLSLVSWESHSRSFSPVLLPLSRSGSRLWHCQSRHRDQQHCHLETPGCHEVPHPRRYGRYLGHLWHDRGRHYQSERYRFLNLVKKDGSYNYKFGYSHMASGLVCGFSCVVLGFGNAGSGICHWHRGRCGDQM